MWEPCTESANRRIGDTVGGGVLGLPYGCAGDSSRARCLVASSISTRVAGDTWASRRVMNAKVSYSGGSSETA